MVYNKSFMFKKVKNNLITKMLKARGVGEEEAQKALSMMEKNPELFKKIAKEIQERVNSGEGKEVASFAVMQKYQKELSELS